MNFEDPGHEREAAVVSPGEGRSGARIVGDLGGTNARFAVLGSSGALERIEVLTCAEFAGIEDAIARYRSRQAIGDVAEVCLAVAGPVAEDRVILPNSHWVFSRSELERALGARLLVINDFTAQALCIDRLRADELAWIGAPRPVPDGIRVVVGPGTGLGVAIQMPDGEVVPSEGGHAGYAPTNDHELELLRVLHTRYSRLSIERLVSGPGLENLYWANRRIAGGDAADGEGRSAPEIAALAAGGEALAVRSVADFFDILAAFAGDLALIAWAAGGVYLSGGVFQKLLPFFDAERFRARFENKGRFTGFCQSVAIARITAEQPGLLGCAAALDRGRPGGARVGANASTAAAPVSLAEAEPR
jgi:glucokinase